MEMSRGLAARGPEHEAWKHMRGACVSYRNVSYAALYISSVLVFLRFGVATQDTSTCGSRARVGPALVRSAVVPSPSL
jgi:hypothetical protein